MQQVPFIVGFGGTTRTGSTSERALRMALACVRSMGCETDVFVGDRLPAEIYDPARPGRGPVAAAFVDALRRADGVIIATPAYHGGVSGLVKNALDFVEDLAEDERKYFDDRAIGLLVCAHGSQAMGSTLASLRAIVHALRGWPTPYGATITTADRPYGEDGVDEDFVQACELVARQVVQFARMAQAVR